jgi:DMSO/TMAO reductase YedYZ heme-binding membrane subunit
MIWQALPILSAGTPMSFSHTDFSTLSIMIIGLAAVGLIVALAVASVVGRKRQLGS